MSSTDFLIESESGSAKALTPAQTLATYPVLPFYKWGAGLKAWWANRRSAKPVTQVVEKDCTEELTALRSELEAEAILLRAQLERTEQEKAAALALAKETEEKAKAQINELEGKLSVAQASKPEDVLELEPGLVEVNDAPKTEPQGQVIKGAFTAEVQGEAPTKPAEPTPAPAEEGILALGVRVERAKQKIASLESEVETQLKSVVSLDEFTRARIHAEFHEALSASKTVQAQFEKAIKENDLVKAKLYVQAIERGAGTVEVSVKKILDLLAQAKPKVETSAQTVAGGASSTQVDDFTDNQKLANTAFALVDQLKEVKDSMFSVEGIAGQNPVHIAQLSVELGEQVDEHLRQSMAAGAQFVRAVSGDRRAAALFDQTTKTVNNLENVASGTLGVINQEIVKRADKIRPPRQQNNGDGTNQNRGRGRNQGQRQRQDQQPKPTTQPKQQGGGERRDPLLEPMLQDATGKFNEVGSA